MTLKLTNDGEEYFITFGLHVLAKGYGKRNTYADLLNYIATSMEEHSLKTEAQLTRELSELFTQ